MKYGRRLSIAFFAAVVLSGCGAQPDTSVAPAAHETVAVVTSFFPLAKIVETIGGEYVTVENLAGGQEVHAYTPSPRDLQKMREADVVVVLGGVEPWAEDVVPQLQREGRQVIVLQDHVPFVAVAADHDTLHDHDDVHAHAEEHESHGDHHGDTDVAHTHDHGGVDPHVWVDPVKVQEMTHAIGNALAQADPLHAETYRRNSAAMVTALDAVDVAYREQLGACTGRAAMVSHDAFGYIARRYAITLHPIAGLSTMDEPSAKFLAMLRETAQRDHVTHVLAEQNSVQNFADMVARGSGLTIVAIDALERATEHNMATDYPALLMENLSALTTALECAPLDVLQ